MFKLDFESQMFLPQWTIKLDIILCSGGLVMQL